MNSLTKFLGVCLMLVAIASFLEDQHCGSNSRRTRGRSDHKVAIE